MGFLDPALGYSEIRVRRDRDKAQGLKGDLDLGQELLGD